MIFIATFSRYDHEYGCIMLIWIQGSEENKNWIQSSNEKNHKLLPYIHAGLRMHIK
jgi:hypothetical protein